MPVASNFSVPQNLLAQPLQQQQQQQPIMPVTGNFGAGGPSNLFHGAANAGGENHYNMYNNFVPGIMNRIDTGQNQLVSVCSPLGVDIPALTISKIVNSEFVDFTSLLDKSIFEQRDKGGGEAQNFVSK